ncbi:3-ketosteroid-delta-1-dehydrogenase [Niallia taxi]|uniref:3-ketosteroid-delta-1-dehydrogenase n=1 Tax=unclassified Niallia TaxID=2837522 RepID=UPI002044AF75|nr:MULTISPECIES: 3-ketosteroid-delta-1-dehydrogenase [Niallia]MCM3033305.1 3-ketosteroid-delta-1-dehydrogenase [Niallia sp. MER 6]MDE5055374.1 3-ketosteroid-delta-1-dehydrogenase [Niallia taxi]GKU84052.1 hypothetical protein NCCP28_34480 [Niallia sp. NCCP-28]
MSEEKRDITAKGFEGLYEVTRSGMIMNKKTSNIKVFDGNPYNFKNVHLYKEGKRTLFRTYDLWKDAFGEDAAESEYKGLK